jgi:hypothetical protein
MFSSPEVQIPSIIFNFQGTCVTDSGINKGDGFYLARTPLVSILQKRISNGLAMMPYSDLSKKAPFHPKKEKEQPSIFKEEKENAPRSLLKSLV